MANAKISQITEDTTAADDDILYGTDAAGTVDKRFTVATVRGARLESGDYYQAETNDGITVLTFAVEDDDDLGGSTPSDLVLPTQGNVFNFFANRFPYAVLGSNYVHTQSNTALANVSGLSVSVVANAIYRVELDGYYIADGAADMKIGFTGPAGATLTWQGIGFPLNASVSGAQAVLMRRHRSISEAETFGGQGTAASDDLAFAIVGTLTTSSTAGTLQVQAAQGTSSATNTTLLAQSSLWLTRRDTDG